MTMSRAHFRARIASVPTRQARKPHDSQRPEPRTVNREGELKMDYLYSNWHFVYNLLLLYASVFLLIGDIIYIVNNNISSF